MQRFGSFDIKGGSGDIIEDTLASSGVSSLHKTEASDMQPSQEHLLNPFRIPSLPHEDALTVQRNEDGLSSTLSYVGVPSITKRQRLKLLETEDDTRSHIMSQRTSSFGVSSKTERLPSTSQRDGMTSRSSRIRNLVPVTKPVPNIPSHYRNFAYMDKLYEGCYVLQDIRSDGRLMVR